MTTLAFVKTVGNLVMPADQPTADVIAKAKLGTVFQGDFKKPRNPAFHRKYFALLNLAFDYWEPEFRPVKGCKHFKLKAEKSFDQFRKDLTILAGYYTADYRLDGSVRVNAKSISFGSMDEAEFEKLYSATIDVILRRVMTGSNREEIERLVDEILLNFA